MQKVKNDNSSNIKNNDVQVQSLESGVLTTGSVKHLVVDSGALILGAKLDSFSAGVTFWSLPEVLQGEIRDKATREMVEKFPFEIKERQVSDEAMAAVCAFAKQTGDYYTLSAVDLKVIALAYMIEREQNGMRYLRERPLLSSPQERPQQHHTNKPKQQPVQPQASVAPATQPFSTLFEAKPFDVDDLLFMSRDDFEAKHGIGGSAKAPVSLYDQISQDNGNTDNKDDGDEEATRAMIQKRRERLWSHTSDIVETVTLTSSAQESKNDNGGAEEDASSDEGEWITPDNLHRQFHPIEDDASKAAAAAKAEAEAAQKRALDAEEAARAAAMASSSEDSAAVRQAEEEAAAAAAAAQAAQDRARQAVSAASVSKVATVTTDYAMQNVMLQMGLRLVSVDGRAIRSLRQWAKRCHACFAITKDMSKIFCPECGGQTLVRMAVFVDPHGRVFYRGGYRKEYNNRGTVYSVPLPKGGRVNKDAVLRADQLMGNYGGAQLHRRKKKDVFDAFNDGLEFGANTKQRRNQSQNVYGGGTVKQATVQKASRNAVKKNGKFISGKRRKRNHRRK
eukprot:TRINITY_DN66083_c9_g4_i1.p1 TRINITY_DN66083_c9_g4~~TRINITY_DN66083_c9_g4_i1.p1  ORF type:complete len:645 (-),score=323.61 TRINITY_DN66083_c9_g4_i1:616-2307(-)